jgi:8-oxo-dGTP diphosphatase
MAIGRFYGGIGALIWSPRNDRYLLLRRSSEKDFASGVWECVTGRVDQGEGFEDAVHREVSEELGVDVAIEFFIGTTHFYRGEEGPDTELIGIVCCCSLEDPDSIQISAEHSAFRWVNFKEADALLDAADPSTQWIRRVLTRAEELRHLTPPALRRYHRARGFELG